MSSVFDDTAREGADRWVTVDPREVDWFSESSQSEGSAARARDWLVKYNPVRLAFLRASLASGPVPRALAGARVLDVGCGTGLFAEALAREGGLVTGVDPAPGALSAARANAERAGLRIDYRAQPLESMSERFDAVTAMEVIEHVPDPAQFIRSCAARVAPGGVLVLSTINRTAKSFLYAIVCGEYLFGMLPRGAHRWSRFVKPSEIASELARQNFVNLRSSGVTLNIRTRALQLARDDQVNFLISANAPGL